jgi:signal transduction histidine kinase
VTAIALAWTLLGARGVGRWDIVRVVDAAGARGSERRWPVGVGWVTATLVTAVVAINVAGIVEITVARRGAVEEAARNLQLETGARARAVESVLASTRADLLFLTGSPTFFGLERALGSRDPREARWRRLEAEGAFLLFLRGHPEVTRLAAWSDGGRPLVEAGRRGGVPVLWVPGRAPDGEEEPAGAARAGARERSVTGRFEFKTGVRRISGAATLEAAIDLAKLLEQGATGEGADRICRITDATGSPLVSQPAMSAASAGDPPAARAALAADGWSAPAPWSLECARRSGSGAPPLEPVVARYRTTLLLNLAMMSLTLVLGGFALAESLRRRHLEASAREEARVRDLERRLFHAERLGTVGRLAAGIAHEINNPLEGMTNYLGLLREDLGRTDLDSARRRLDGVREGLERAVSIVRRVLAHADPARAPLAPIDLNAGVAQSVEFVRTRPEFAGIRFDLDLAPGGTRVLGSPTLLGQVWLNLLLNACEAQPRGGEVRVGARREGRRAVVEIADRGPGVPRAESARIFEPFYSTKNSTGLGLSVCHTIVNQHGGELRVEERPGGGAVFVIALPVFEEEVAGGGDA